MLNYQLLQALVAVVAEKGFEKAAETLFITQSAVSRRIYQLESLLGEPVLIRSKPPRPTELGEKLLTHFQQVQQLELALNLKNVGHDLETEQPITVKLVANADSIATWLPAALAMPQAVSQYQYAFKIQAEDQSVGLRRMKAGEVMVCICSSESPVNGGKVYPLGALRYHVVCSPSFVKRYTIESPDQLVELPCLVFNEDDKLQHHFLASINNRTPGYTHQCPSSQGFKQAMIAGLGYGLLPALQLGDSLQTGELVNIMPDYVVDVPLYWHCWEAESPQLKQLREFACRIASEHLLPLE